MSGSTTSESSVASSDVVPVTDSGEDASPSWADYFPAEEGYQCVDEEAYEVMHFRGVMTTTRTVQDVEETSEGTQLTVRVETSDVVEDLEAGVTEPPVVHPPVELSYLLADNGELWVRPFSNDFVEMDAWLVYPPVSQLAPGDSFDAEVAYLVDIPGEEAFGAKWSATIEIKEPHRIESVLGTFDDMIVIGISNVAVVPGDGAPSDMVEVFEAATAMAEAFGTVDDTRFVRGFGPILTADESGGTETISCG